MKELIKITENNGKTAVSARELYKFLEVTERFNSWMDRQFQYGFQENVDFVGRKEFNALANQVLTDYVLTVECAKEISMLQKSEKGKQARVYFIECEKKLKSVTQLPDFNNPVIAARAWADEVEAKQLAQSKVKELQPKAEIADMINSAQNNLTMNEASKILGVRRNLLMKELRECKILMSNNTPYQQYLNSGYFVVKVTPIKRGDYEFNTPQTYVTAKGLTWLAEKMK